MAKLALYKGKGKIGNALVRWWTDSKYSHCELIVGDMAFSSSVTDGGVRAKRIDFHPKNWDIIALPQRLDHKIIAHFNETTGEPYGWLDLLRSQIFNSGANQDGATFCSEWCAAAIGLPNPTSYSPRTLGELVAHLNATPWAEMECHK